MPASLTRFPETPSARSASRLVGWLLLPVGASLVPAAAALDAPWLHLLAVVILASSATALAASLKDDPA